MIEFFKKLLQSRYVGLLEGDLILRIETHIDDAIMACGRIAVQSPFAANSTS
jgi:hypothetical protein